MNEYDEIDLVDLAFYCLKKWRRIVIIMFIFAVLVGVYEYQATNRENVSKSIILKERETKKAETEEKETKVTPITLEDPVVSAMKFSVLGSITGAFLVVVLLILKYVMQGRLQSTKNFKRDFGIQLLGNVIIPEKRKRWFGFVDAWILKLEKGPYAKIPYEEQIKILAANVQNAISKKKSLKKIMFAGTIEKEDAEAVCQALILEIEDVLFSEYKQIAFQASALRELKNYDGIIFIERKGISYSKYIRLEKEFVDEREVNILGTIIL